MAGAAPARPVQEVQRRRRPARLSSNQTSVPAAASRCRTDCVEFPPTESRPTSNGPPRARRRRGPCALRAREGAGPVLRWRRRRSCTRPGAAASSTKKCPIPPDAPARRNCASVERSTTRRSRSAVSPAQGSVAALVLETLSGSSARRSAGTAIFSAIRRRRRGRRPAHPPLARCRRCRQRERTPPRPWPGAPA